MAPGLALSRTQARAALGLLSVAGFVLGTAALVAPGPLAHLSGQAAGRRLDSWPWRLFAVRELGLSWALFDAARQDSPGRARTATGWLIWSQAGDLAVATCLGTSGLMPRRTSLLIGFSAAPTLALAVACRRAHRPGRDIGGSADASIER